MLLVIKFNLKYTAIRVLYFVSFSSSCPPKPLALLIITVTAILLPFLGYIAVWTRKRGKERLFKTYSILETISQLGHFCYGRFAHTTHFWKDHSSGSARRESIQLTGCSRKSIWNFVMTKQIMQSQLDSDNNRYCYYPHYQSESHFHQCLSHSQWLVFWIC